MMGFHKVFVALVLLLAVNLGLSSQAYQPVFDAEEQENITVYDHCAQAVVTINALVNGQPSSGSGVLVDPSGLIITSSHVIGNATTVFISLEDGRRGKGVVIGRSGAPLSGNYSMQNMPTTAETADLALIKVSFDAPTPYLKLADSDKVKVGQKVLAIGHPYGFERSLTTGIISRVDKQRDRLQTDAAINPGSSGGPILDTQGYVLGVNQSIYNPDGNRSNIGIGFSVPANTIKAFLKNLALEQPMPASVAAMSRKPVIRYQDRTPGYEAVSMLLQQVGQN